MIKKLIHALPLALLLSSTASADVITLWEYGDDDDNSRGRLNATEFSNTPGIINDVEFVVEDTPGYIVNGPGYMHDSMSFKQICVARGLACQNGSEFQATPSLTIVYMNNDGLTCTNVKLTYDRHGTEHNKIQFINMSSEQTDSIELTIGGKEAKQSRHEIDLQDFAYDGMMFYLEYRGSGADNGHFIDYIKLTGDCHTS